MDLDELLDLEALRDARRRGRERRRTRARSTSSRSGCSARRASSRAILRGIGALPAEDRPKVGAIANQVRGSRRDRARRAPREPRRRRARGAPGRGDRRRHDARPPDPPRLAPPDRRDGARDRATSSRQFGFVVYEGPEVEDDVTNFQMLNIPPDHPARDLWDTLYARRRGPAPADPHVARPDPGDAPGAAADPRDAARALLPLRGGRRQPRDRVLPGRGADGRRGHVDGRPQGPPRPVRPRDVRRGPRDALPAGLLPVHGAIASPSTSCASSAAARAARRARAPAG